MSEFLFMNNRILMFNYNRNNLCIIIKWLFYFSFLLSHYCPFYFEYVGIPILRFFRSFSIFWPPKPFEIAPNRWGMVWGYFPDIFYFYEKIDFLTILALLGLQNVPVGPKNGQNGRFRPFLANFGVQKVRDPPKSIRMRSRNPWGVSPEKLWGHYGTGRGILGDPWAHIGPLDRFPNMEVHFGLQKSTFLDPKMSKKVRKPLLNDSVTSVSLRLTNLSSLGGVIRIYRPFWGQKGLFLAQNRHFWSKMTILSQK